MKTAIILALLCAIAYAEDDVLPLAVACDTEACELPSCRCSSSNIPGGLTPRQTPQFVTVTFDDAVTAVGMINYRDILYNRFNKNNCSVGATFYVSHEWTDYSAVNELYNNGFEIALHSISHQTPQTYWRDATYDDIAAEIGDQKAQMAHLANIPESAVHGVRLPFLQLSGNTTFEVMRDYGLTYDCSWGTIAHTNPGLWPYTLDYASTQDCQIPPCPTASLPGLWVQPLVAWTDTQGFPCSMVDACVFVPDRNDADAWFNFILRNFERHYLNNRAPFGFYIHEAYLRGWPKVKEAMVRFIDLLNNLNDVFMVNSSEVLEWVKNPIPIDEYKAKQCRTWLPSPCSPSFCPLTATHNNWNYYMTVCNSCPRVYPWLGNPLGQ